MLFMTLFSSFFCLASAADDANNLVAHYTFDEGSGDVLHDRSGNGHDGKIVGSQWALQEEGCSLRFRERGDCVDFGDDRGLKIAGDVAILAWVRLDASPFPDDATNWTIVDCEDYRKEGYILRIDGASSRVMYRVNQSGSEQYGFGATALENHAVHCVGVVRRGDAANVYVNGIPDVEFSVKTPVFGNAPFRISSAGQSFSGAIFEVVILNRALDGNEMAERYWRGAEHYRKDLAKRGQLYLAPYIYYEDKEAHAEVDFLGVMPLVAGEHVNVELARRSGETWVTKEVFGVPKEGRADYTFPLEGLTDGEYELRAVLKGGARKARASATFNYPIPPVVVPSPESLTIDPLPAEPSAPAYQVNVTPGGGAFVTVERRTFPVESSFSFPKGGSNKLVCAGAQDKDGEAEWQVTSCRVDASTWQVDARGKFYAVSRRMKSEADRILVSDTITNVASEPVGIILHNRLRPDDAGISKAYLAGKETTTHIAERELKVCPTIFVSSPGLGLGLVALDDVYIVQSRGGFDEREGIDLFSKELALNAAESYTLEWAVYVNATGDYYDFINAIRRDEHRNGVTVEGALAFIPGSQRKRDASLVPAAKQYYDFRNLRYLTSACLSWCTDDPEISVEGIEFIEYPQERQRIRSMMDALKTARPDVKGMFHVAHQLYANNRPDDHFPDSRVIDAEGKQTVYPNDYANGAYFSRQRYEDNWRWWIYYPTLENSFGKALLQSVDVMMDELGCRGVFADGFLWGYGGEYTYDRWDGHSADIDPETQTIKRKKASTLLITQDAMIAWCRKIWEKGGVVIANGVVPTRTLCSLPLIMDKEVAEGPDVPLLPTPVTLGNPGACLTERGVYQDVLNKLRWGNLYFYYGEPEALTHESVPARMYPITVQEVHSGYIKGKERLITMHSGVYGWPDSRDLHMAYRYDSRGHRTRAGCITVVDAASVRTQVVLGDKEIGVLERIPVKVESPEAVHIVVERYDEDGLLMTTNGKGSVKIVMPDGKEHMQELNGQQQVNWPAP
jgi:hypothetical protein